MHQNQNRKVEEMTRYHKCLFLFHTKIENSRRDDLKKKLNYYHENDHNSDANNWSEEVVQLFKIICHLILVRRRCTDFHRNPLEPGPRGGKTEREGIE